MKISYHQPVPAGRELDYLWQAAESQHLAGDGEFTRRATAWLDERLAPSRTLLTHSGTAALEMAALLLDLGPGDEVIVPSFTFSSTANAIALRGATPVFVDVRADTLNLDELLVEGAITERTRAVFAVHYAGVGCEMRALAGICEHHGLRLVEDAAQGLLASYDGRPLGTLGHLGALSFHESKNVFAGEGGALIVNDPDLHERAEILREKGTDRSRFFRGEVDRYTWRDLGSSFLPGELAAAFLLGQLEMAEETTRRRAAVWQRYHGLFEPLEREQGFVRPTVPPDAVHNGHLYYLLVPPGFSRDGLLRRLQSEGIQALFHYQPLHLSPAGRRFGRCAGELPVTEDIADRLIRVPLWPAMQDEVEYVADAVKRHVASAPVAV